MKKTLNKVLPYTILLISISSILQWCSLPIGNTFVWWLLYSFIIFIFLKLKPNKYTIYPIRIFLLYVVFSAIYGAIYMTENYWDWKLLINNLMVFSLPLASPVFNSPFRLIDLLKCWFRYAWIIILILFPFLGSDAFGRFLVPFTFLSLFPALLNKKYLILTISAYLVTIILGSDSRSDMIKFTICILLGISSLWPNAWKCKRLIKTIWFTLIISPIILLILGITNTFNIFKIGEELGIDEKYTMTNSSGEKYSALTDTRTLLYVEQIESALKHDYVIYGRSIARGHDSALFGDFVDEQTGTSRGERQKCETSILNIFNYFGLVGVLIYFIIFAKASYTAINKSSNSYIPIIGIYVAFRWLYAWVEDFSNFDLNYLFIWIFIGICYSPYFRNMNDIDFKQYIQKICK